MTPPIRPTQGFRDRAGQWPADLLTEFADAIPMPVLLATPDMRICHANTTFVRTLDAGAEHYLLRKFPRRWLMQPEDGIAQLRELLHRADRSGTKPAPVRLSLRAADGSEIRTEVHACPLPDLDGSAHGLTVVTFKPVAPHESPAPTTPSEAILERLNTDLESSLQDLEQSNRELASLAHIAADDLKGSSHGIETPADGLDANGDRPVGPEGPQNLPQLRGRVDRMNSPIDRVLPEAEIGHDDRSVEALDTNVLIEEALEQIAPPEHIEIQIEGILPTVHADRTWLAQVFQTLLSNAVKYIDKPQGQIHVGARNAGAFWEFFIADNGPGIEAERLARLLRMFQSPTLAGCGSDTGLGLAVVKRIVDLYGGRIWIESEMGRGSTVFFTLPKHLRKSTREDA